MIIELNTKYEIGQKIDEQIIIDGKVVGVKHLIISNIKVTFDYLSQKVTLSYELTFDNEQGFVYGWFEL